jgi:hypothetical protein
MNATRFRLLGGLGIGCLLSAGPAYPQQPAQPMTQAAVAPPARVFGSPTGVVLNFIKPDKTADFEAVVAKLKDALQNSSNAARKEQAASWRVYKSSDPGPAGAVLYVYIVDPVVKGADYGVAKILGEGFPGEEVPALIKQYNDSYASGQNFVNLTLVSDLGK